LKFYHYNVLQGLSLNVFFIYSFHFLSTVYLAAFNQLCYKVITPLVETINPLSNASQASMLLATDRQTDKTLSSFKAPFPQCGERA